MQAVAGKLLAGQDKEKIVKGLRDKGLDKADAYDLVEDAGSHKALAGNERVLAKIRSFAERNAGSIYAEAATHCLNDGKAPNSIVGFFLDRNSEIAKFGYPVP